MKTVLASGCFDILHVGHLMHLEAARALGDRLVVAVTSDRFVNKGPGRPVFEEGRRMQLVRALRCVDEVILSDEAVPYKAIEKIAPAVYAKGIEYAGRLPEQEFVERLGGRVIFTPTAVFSSTKLLGWL